MKSNYLQISIRVIISIALFTALWANEVQDITIHKKSNGTLVRIVTSKVMDMENLAGWIGQKNWFYVTFNASYLNPSAMDYLSYHLSLIWR